MNKKRVQNIAVSIVFLVPFLFFGGCNTEDVEIDGTGIETDSVEIFIDTITRRNAFIVSSLYPWTLQYRYEQDKSWLSVEPREGNRSATINISGTVNDYRRRTTFLILSNGYRDTRVKVIQRASPDYEPGIVILSENFGRTDVTARTTVASYTTWGRTGTGISSVSYSGSGAVVQADVTSQYDADPPISDVLEGYSYPDATGGNNVEIAPGGNFFISRINVSAYDRMILTFHVASTSGNSFTSDPSGSIRVEGGTLEDVLEEIDFDVIPLHEDHGWQKVVAEFRKITGAGNFYLQFTNTGTNPVYIDDIMLEAAGKGTTVIGTPVPNVTTYEPENVTSRSATLRGMYTLPAGISHVGSAGFEYRHNTESTYTVRAVPGTVNGQIFEYALENPQPDEVYFYRAYAEVDGYVSYGSDVTLVIRDAEEEEGDE